MKDKEYTLYLLEVVSKNGRIIILDSNNIPVLKSYLPSIYDVKAQLVKYADLGLKKSEDFIYHSIQKEIPIREWAKLCLCLSRNSIRLGNTFNLYVILKGIYIPIIRYSVIQ